VNAISRSYLQVAIVFLLELVALFALQQYFT
jgi:hypothetical protein